MIAVNRTPQLLPRAACLVRVGAHEERQQQRRSIIWLSVAAGAIVAFVLLSGQLVSIGYEYDDDEDESEE